MKSLSKLVRNFFKGWNIFEYAFFALSFAVPITLGLVFKTSVFEIMTSVTALIVAVLFAKAKVEGFFLSIISTGLFIYISWTHKLYGEMIIQIVVSIPIIVIGLISWARNRRKDRKDGFVIIVGHVGWRELAIVVASQLAAGVGYYFLLKLFGTQYVIASAISLEFSIIAGYLLIRRSRKAMKMSVLSDISSIVVWAFVFAGELGFGRMGTIVMLVTECMFFAIDTFGIFNWHDLKERQQKRTRKAQKAILINETN